MPIDPRIPLGVQPPRMNPPDLAGTLLAGARLKDLAADRDYRRVQTERVQGDMDRERAVRQAFVPGDPKKTLANLTQVDPALAYELQAQQEAKGQEQEAAAEQKQQELRKDFAGRVWSYYTTPAEQRSSLYPKLREEALGTGLYTPEEFPETPPDDATLRYYALVTMDPAEQQKVLDMVAAERRARAQETRDVEKGAAELAKTQAEATGAELGLAGRTLPESPEEWAAWHGGLSTTLQRLIPAEFSEQAVNRVRKMELPRKEREELENAGTRLAETKRHNREMETRAAAGGTSGAMAGNIEATAEGIVNGMIPPPNTESRPTQYSMALTGELQRKGYDLSTARRDWVATQRHMASLNGTQQLRLREAVTFTYDSLDVIEDLYAAWRETPYYQGQRTVNKGTLEVAKQIGGESGAIAQALEAQINDLISELGTVYKGGNSSTDESLRLAAENLKAEWDEAAFTKALGLIRKNLQIRKNSIFTSPPAGVSPDSPYVPREQRNSGGEAPDPTQFELP